MKRAHRLLLISGLCLSSGVLIAQSRSVINSPHNLSVSGPGEIRAAAEQRVCIFCHTPHNASPVRPLWNRYMPVNAYRIYSSSSLNAKPGQPTGSSKMCLSCHDGTIALGSVVSQNQIIHMSGGITTLPPGSSNLGTDLSDDHPISFRYDSSLAFKDRNLADPRALPDNVPLDHNNELQCTTCHDAHDNSFGDFLVMGNENSQLCRTCHTISTTTIFEHQDCRSCHQPHSAPSGPFLLVRDRITETCVSCHNGTTPNASNILADLQKVSVHDTRAPIDSPDHIPQHVTCSDCHEPHTMMMGAANAPDVPYNFGQVTGISGSGALLDDARHEYEVCFKCHAEDNAFSSSWIPRQIEQVNTRLEFELRAASYHPVMGPGRNPNVPSLRPGLNEGSTIYCTDCHASDTSKKAGGSGPNGPHGSNYPPLLIDRYETTDFTPESATAYALCYRCHERDTGRGILRNASFAGHSLHVRDQKTPCSVCHDAHGISSAQGTRMNNSHLINFDISVVFPDPVTGRREFVDTGTFSGKCFLSCHGKNHSPLSY